MRIAILTNAFLPMPGGAAHVAGLHAGMLREAGHEVEVFRPEIPWLKYPAPVRIFFHLHDLLSHREMTDKIIAWHPDMLLTHNLTGCGFGTPSATRNALRITRNVKWVHVLHDVQLFQPSGALPDATPFTLWQKLWSALRRRALKNPDLVISPTSWLLEQHQRRGFFQDVKTEILPNPAPAVSFAMRAPSEPLKLFFLGRTPQKGTELLTRLIPRLERAHLHVVEPSKEMEELSKRFPDRVRMDSFLPNDQVLDAMREADVMLFPSQIMENQPTVLLEAASVGLPAIASDVGGVRETLKGAGIVVSKDDIQAWIDAVEFLRDPSNYREQTMKMYELAKQHDVKEYASGFLSLITSPRI